MASDTQDIRPSLQLEEHEVCIQANDRSLLKTRLGQHRSLPQISATAIAIPSYLQPKEFYTPHFWQQRRRTRAANLEELISVSFIENLCNCQSARDARNNIKELRKRFRIHAREVGWVLEAQYSQKPIKTSPLADSLRYTLMDEDDVIDEYLFTLNGQEPDDSLYRELTLPETVDKIILLRYALRLLARIKAEHPDAVVRSTAATIIEKLNGERVTRRIPTPQLLHNGPSFFYSEKSFSSLSELCKFNHLSYNSEDTYSSDDDSDMDDAGSTAISINLAYTQRIWKRWGLIPHLFQLLNPLPQCGLALDNTIHAILQDQRSDIKLDEAYYLATIACAQVGCYPMVCMTERLFITSAGDESWITKGISGASEKIKLLARFGHKLAFCPWNINSADIQIYVDEYINIYQSQRSSSIYQVPCSPPSSSSVLRFPGKRRQSISDTTVNKTLKSIGELPLKSIEAVAIRDLTHAIVIMSVFHGLSSFALACGMVPDIDHPSGSYFNCIDSSIPSEFTTATSLNDANYSEQKECTRDLSESSDTEPAENRMGKTDSKIASSLNKIQQSSSVGYDKHSEEVQQQTSLPSLHAVSQKAAIKETPGIEPNIKASLHRSEGVDPLSDQSPQFEAYRRMANLKLQKYIFQDQFYSTDIQSEPSSYTAGDNSKDTFLEKTKLGRSILHNCSNTPYYNCLYDIQTSNIRALQLSDHDDLHWDVLSYYLKKQLSIDEDVLGREKELACRITEPLQEKIVYSDVRYDVEPKSVNCCTDKAASIKSDSLEGCDTLDKYEKKGESEGQHSMSLVSCNSNSLELANSQRFYDAIWHYTLSLHHIYEEYYFYDKYKGELPVGIEYSSNDCTQYTHTESSVPIPSDASIDKAMNVDLDSDRAFSPTQKNPDHRTGHTNWLSSNMKKYIRNTISSSANINTEMTQPYAAASLNLSIENMIRINLIISLARRQAEIIFSFRAICDYENTNS